MYHLYEKICNIINECKEFSAFVLDLISSSDNFLLEETSSCENVNLLKLALKINKDGINGAATYYGALKNAEILKLLIDAEVDFSSYSHHLSPFMNTPIEIKNLLADQLHAKISLKKIAGESFSAKENEFILTNTLFNQGRVDELTQQHMDIITKKALDYIPLNKFEKMLYITPIQSKAIINKYWKDDVPKIFGYSMGIPNNDIMVKVLEFLPLSEVVSLTPFFTKYGIRNYIGSQKINTADKILLERISTTELIKIYNKIENPNEVTMDAQLEKEISQEEQTFIDPTDIYQASSSLKGLNAAVDLIRFVYVPTSLNAVRLGASFLDTYIHMHGKVNVYYPLINFLAYTVPNYGALSNINTLQPIFNTIHSAVLPIIMIQQPYFFTASVATAAIFDAYNFITNAHSLYNELDQKDFQISSYIAYKNIADMLSKTPLQNLYDFSGQAEKYMEEVEKLKLDEQDKSSHDLPSVDFVGVAE